MAASSALRGPVRGRMPPIQGDVMRPTLVMRCSFALLGILLTAPLATLAQTPATSWDPGNFASSFTLRTIAQGLVYGYVAALDAARG